MHVICVSELVLYESCKLAWNLEAELVRIYWEQRTVSRRRRDGGEPVHVKIRCSPRVDSLYARIKFCDLFPSA